jgi:hypothetical protein
VRRAVVGIVLAAILALAGCGSAATTTHHPKASGTTSALYQKSFRDGESYGQMAGLPGSSPSQVQANCGVLRLQDMPTGDIASGFMAGCMLTGLIAANSGG